jgi:hypothetical protein
MASVSSGDVVNLFKKVYGDMTDLVPEDYLLAKDIPFSQKQKVGEKYVEAVVLTNETGITYGGSALDAFELNPAVAGTVQQTEVTPYISVLSSIVPWGVLSRAAGAGERAFYDATRHVVKNNIKSHGKFKEIDRLYGQATAKLGYVSYATATYRNVAFTTGTGTLNGVSFTNGVSSLGSNQWAILFAPGQFASGIWVGMEGVQVQELNSSNVVVAEGKLVGVESEFGYIIVDFAPTAASGVTSHKIAFKGWADSKEQIGMNKILSTQTGTLFGINVANYQLFRGRVKPLANKKLTLERLNLGVAEAVNGGGLDGDLDVYVNPRTWAGMMTTESGLRRYDDSYKGSEAETGFEAIKFHIQTGTAMIKAHRFVKEGEAYAVHRPDWSRSGSAEISFTIPGIDREVIHPLENQAAYKFSSYTDQYVFCHAPAKSILFTEINDEATS